MIIASQTVAAAPEILNIVGVLITILLSIIAYFLRSFHLDVKELKQQFNLFQIQEAGQSATSKSNENSFLEAMRRYETQYANICRITDRRIHELTKIVEKHEVELNVIKVKIS